jgi:predicted small secreted protein
MLKKLLALALLVGMTGSMVACETMEGLGQDTQKAGRSLENSADRNK